MAFLIVGGVTVPVAVGQAAEGRPQLGEVVRAFDGSPRSSVRDALREWEIQTIPVTGSLAATLLAVLEGAHPITCSGDLLGGSVACVPTDISAPPVKTGAVAPYRTISFRLLAPP
jgi:hypothetical protein